MFTLFQPCNRSENPAPGVFKFTPSIRCALGLSVDLVYETRGVLGGVVIGFIERLHSADNPTEIAHGFPVVNAENKHTPLEYPMKGPQKIPKVKFKGYPTKITSGEKNI